ncbi:putative Ig domain-containing protein [Rhodococcus sp. ARC_M6]|uniref:putative Ig domain-containing protein n=1 Tax=Rhodococcus sp. ARC_M6 TaxID=2928852 RepID=UPI001FB286D4|nr:putative Ig domain-containing protein [Rhodococcus sp. ARC_M6]MCJ0903676.1 putative Ig domain-containing protein [Rhodococcus sp. ARC_M6]
MPTNGGYTAISAGGNHSLALTNDGHITIWGDVTMGQRWDAPTDGGYIAISAGTWYSTALTADGQIVTWGLNDVGQAAAGIGHTAISAGGAHALALNPLSAPTVTGTPPAGSIDQPYSYAFTVTGYPAFTVTSTGTLPEGLILTEAGVLSGTPTKTGSFTFTVMASNSEGEANPLPVTVEITEAALPSTGSLDFLGPIFGS